MNPVARDADYRNRPPGRLGGNRGYVMAAGRQAINDGGGHGVFERRGRCDPGAEMVERPARHGLGVRRVHAEVEQVGGQLGNQLGLQVPAAAPTLVVPRSAVIETGQGRFGIINTHSLAETPGDIATVEPISYDKEDKEGRVGRREERWTPVSHVPW